VLPTYIDFDPWVSTVSGNISANTTWTASSTYVVDGTLTVDAGKMLTIWPGTVVKFKTAASEIVVDGTLDAKGGTSDTHRIHFTSYEDDTVGGDTNGDGTASSPAAGDWNGILVNEGGSMNSKGGRIAFGGYTGGRSMQLSNNGGQVLLENTEVATGTTYGIYHGYDFSALNNYIHVYACDIHDHSIGIYINEEPGSIIHSNNIHGNSNYGVFENTLFDIDAQYNYWGASDGPSSPGPGSGDAVSDGIIYTNWLPRVHFLNFDYAGQIISSVGSGEIRWNWYGGSTSTYSSAWYSAVATWNALGTTTIATSTGTTDLEIQDVVGSSADLYLGFYNHNETPDRFVFNSYQMDLVGTSTKQMAATHELGHALGLEHSYFGNIMNSYATASTTLGAQDISDYDYLY
jgi:hypothetical protein